MGSGANGLSYHDVQIICLQNDTTGLQQSVSIKKKKERERETN